MTAAFPFAPLAIYPQKSNGISYGPDQSIQFGLTEANEIRTALMQLETAFAGNDYVAVKNMASSPPDLSASGGGRIVALDGVLWISENGAAYRRLQNTEYVNILDFGAIGNESFDCTIAFTDALNLATTSIFGSARRLLVPKGGYKITANLVAPSNVGFSMVGEGYGSVLQWHGPNGDDFLTINSSQQVALQDIRLNIPTSSNRVGKMVNWDYNPVVRAATGNSMTRVHIGADGADGLGKYDYGIYFSDAYGNNSEFTASQCSITNYALNGITLPGTQQVSHAFYNCQLSGGANDETGGQFGVVVGQGIVNPGAGGAFWWYGGGISSCSKSAFLLTGPSQQICIFGCETEELNRFIDTTEVEPPVPNNGTVPVLVMGCRISFGNSPAPADDSICRINGLGPWTFDHNTFEADAATTLKARIEVVSGGYAVVNVTNNFFSYKDSFTHGPFNLNTIYPPMGELKGNRYVGAGGVLAYRCEPLNVAPLNKASVQSYNNNEYWIALDPSAFVDASPDSSIAILPVPEGAVVKKAFFYLGQIPPNLSGAPDITAAIGSTAGGSQYMLPTLCSGDGELPYGNDGDDMGPSLACAPASGFTPNFTGDTQIFVSLHSSSGNFGNGTTSTLVGQIFIALDIEPKRRWLNVV